MLIKNNQYSNEEEINKDYETLSYFDKTSKGKFLPVQRSSYLKNAAIQL
jgi:hypothetical protein